MSTPTAFDSWLAEELERAGDEEGLSVASVDLATVLAELASLRTEIRSEARAGRELRDRVVELVAQDADSPAQAGPATDDRQRQQLINALLDIGDRLQAALERGQLPEERRPIRLWPWRPREDSTRRHLTALLEGLSLTRARLDTHVHQAGIERIATMGLPFDGAQMRAVDTRQAAAPVGTVVEELSAGYREGDRVLRFAEVIVSKEKHS
jgi:molecular chaperone GrpE (heat shock protein)